LRGSMKTSIQDEVLRRQKNVDKLDKRVAGLSRNLVGNEVKQHEIFVENEYFLKLSEPLFAALPPADQMFYLALWHCQRNWSVPENRFSFQCRKKVNGIVVDFSVYIHAGNRMFEVAVDFSANDDKRKKLEDLGMPVLSFSPVDRWTRPLDIAEEIFTYLDQQAEKRLPSGV
jgi:hypothetical protein